MPIIPRVGRKSPKVRAMIAAVYALLSLGGLAMIIPFLMTLTLSVANYYEHDRFDFYPRYLFSSEERYLKYLAQRYDFWELFPDFRAVYHAPSHWGSFRDIAYDSDAIEKYFPLYGCENARGGELKGIFVDYCAFLEDYDIENCKMNFSAWNLPRYQKFLLERYGGLFLERSGLARRAVSLREYEKGALQTMGEVAGVSYLNLHSIIPAREYHAPFDLQAWFPEDVPSHRDYLDFMRSRPVAERMPITQHYLWTKYLFNKGVRLDEMAWPGGASPYGSVFEVPFRLPENAPPELRIHQRTFLEEGWPVRLVRLSASHADAFRAFARQRFPSIDMLNEVTGASFRGWEDVPFYETAMEYDQTALRSVWRDFALDLPRDEWQLLAPEYQYRRFLLEEYGSLEAIDTAYGWDLHDIGDLELPLAETDYYYYISRKKAFLLGFLTKNYAFAIDFLFFRGRAVWNTLVLVFFSILAALTINPMAAYALSRFRPRATHQILIFLLAVMAFPPMVAAIPSFLLLRDFHMLNTYWALILPGVANGYAIFLLKGFFDSLPQELYEAAAIDGGAGIYHVLPHYHAIVQTHSGRHRPQHVCRRLRRLHVGAYRMSRRAHVDHHGLDDAIQQPLRLDALHHHRGHDTRINPDVVGLCVLPEDHPARYRNPANEIGRTMEKTPSKQPPSRQPSILLGLLLCGAAAGDTLINPVARCADSGVLKCQGRYYISGVGLPGQVLISDNLVDWCGPYKVFEPQLHEFIREDLSVGWTDVHAPCLAYVNGRFHLYWNGIGHAVADSPLGPYVMPVLDRRFDGEIDPFLFADEDGRLYFYTVKFDNGNVIWGQTMAGPDQLAGQPVELFHVTVGTWEANDGLIAEGPEVIRYRNRCYLLYAANHTTVRNGHYAIGCAISDTPLGFNESAKYRYPVVERNELALDDTCEHLLQTGARGGPAWRYTTECPPSNWAQPDFAVPASWQTGKGGFGWPIRPESQVHNVRTPWRVDDIWLRYELHLERRPSRHLKMRLRHVDGAEVYFNGIPAHRSPWRSGPRLLDLPGEAIAALNPGPNTIAAHVNGPSEAEHYFDLGLLDFRDHDPDDLIWNTGQPNVVRGPNGFEWYLVYFGMWNEGPHCQGINRILFFNRELYVDGPTGERPPAIPAQTVSPDICRPF